MKEGVLWMGGLAAYMTEKFLADAFRSLGEEDVVSVEIVKNKFTGEPAGYGFIYFDTDASALIAMHKLNGKIIPNSQPPVRFQLNHSSGAAGAGGANPFTEREFSIWVTDLPDGCTDDLLLRTFATRFDSIKTARVMTDSSHGKKPYGFVRSVSEQCFQ
jgi:RNA recognition motif-containing protein